MTGTGYVEVFQWSWGLSRIIHHNSNVSEHWLNKQMATIIQWTHFYIGAVTYSIKKYFQNISIEDHVIMLSRNLTIFAYSSTHIFKMSDPSWSMKIYKTKIGQKRNMTKYLNCVDIQECRGVPYISIFTLVCNSFPHYQMAIYYNLSNLFCDI